MRYLTVLLTVQLAFLLAAVPGMTVLGASPPDPVRGPFSNPAHVQLEDYFPPVDPEAGYDESVPRPESVLGHTIGSALARHDLVVAWFEALAQASPRVELLDIGTTAEGRRQITALISSPGNVDRLLERQRAHLENAADAPLFTWHGYGIHGDEPSGVQAAMAVAWYLAAGNDPELRGWLRNAVVMIDPALNPDGYGRHATWVNQALGRAMVDDPAHRDRSEAWPGGRTNHYLFDLNRDWLLLQQPESVNRVRLLQRYRPHVMTDHHEMRSADTFFFQPGVASRWHPLIPEANRALTAQLGGYHAAALDRAARLYFRGESFDDFYPGKGSTWPDLQGTVGILFEQAAIGGLSRQTEQGRITLPMAIHNQVLVTLSTLEGAVALKDELRQFRIDFDERRHVPRGLPAGWIFDDGGDPSRAAAMVEIIKGQGLDVFGLSETHRTGGREYLPGRAWVVPVLGARAPLAHTLFADERSFEDSIFYDVSAWSLPHAFGVSAAPLSRVPGRLDTQSRVNRNYEVSGRLEPAAWVMPWDDFFAPAVLRRLQVAGVRTRVALEPFESTSSSKPVRFRRGAVVIHKADVPDVDERKRDFLARIAGGDAPLVGLDGGASGTGPDLGSSRIEPLTSARIAMVADRGANPSAVGSIWHALDRRLGLPVTLVRLDQVTPAVLGRHTHLIIADGEYQVPGEAFADDVRRWVEQGGVLLVTRRAAAWAQTLGWLPAPTDPEADAGPYSYGEMAARDGAKAVGGAILQIELDETHPLAFGIAGGSIGLMRQGRTALKAPWDNPYTVVGSYSAAPLLSGYLPEGYEAELAEQPAILAVPVGEGAVIAFADAPAFRAVWWVGQRLLSNAVSFGAVIRPPGASYGGRSRAGE
jgi:hypothetical protein